MSAEDEKMKAPCRAFVFNSVANQWIERGTGILKITVNNVGRVVVGMKQEKTMKQLINFEVDPKTQLEPSADSTTAWVFKVRSHHIGHGPPHDEVIALQFGSTAIAKQFQSLHDWAKVENEKALETEKHNKQTKKNTKSHQRRLTIDGANSSGLNIDIEQLSGAVEDMDLNSNGKPSKSQQKSQHGTKVIAKVKPTHGVRKHKGVSKKGYSEDPRMKPYNQDRLVMEHDKNTGAWCFCVFDGHGEVRTFVSCSKTRI